ncbi:PREDICTED: anoctamin-9 [Propithecus coquereli]|uniref:anoctamin-9 n=1 Tax=Propithecus coquereli TaxID=379532 RepID=UPI00063FA51F|nr:PREDICTED: anoctamin-9 [Propithecus coquereli]
MQGDESLQILVGTEGDSFPLTEIHACETEASEQWDYVLVADSSTQRIPKQVYRQQQFLGELRRKGFHFKVKKDQKQVFFGIRADNSIFDLYRTLLVEPEGPAPRVEPETPSPIPATTRIRILNFVLSNTTADGETFENLVKDGVFEARFPLHKGEAELKKTWAQWRKMAHRQPIDQIRDYFGEKVALYFAWLGWYTYMLVPAALVGLGIFLSGFTLFESSQISREICAAHTIFLCPLGDHGRRFQRLSDTCTFAKLTHLFDNDGTVLFAIFMALWATVFLEIWKRQRARVVLHWDLYGWDEDQEEMALQLINCPDYKLRLHQHSYLRSSVILALSLFMICFMIGMAHGLVVYRVLAAALFSSSALPFLEEQVTTAVVVTGALVHYVTIVVMTKVNKFVALKLCDFEKPRTFSERESKFTVRFFILQFFAHFSSLIYIAFILGSCPNPPEAPKSWGFLDVHPADLSNSFPARRSLVVGSAASHLIQYGFTTIFVAAFPLAPLLALFSNLVEIRLDAIKMVRLQRRLVPRKAKDIGTWLQVLETIGVLAVIANGMVIAFTSEFIPRVVYKYRYGPCRQGAHPAVDCLTGYVNHSLSIFYTKDFQDPVGIEGSENVTECRYRDYRNAHDYNFSEQFWFLLAIRLAFVILFEHVALCIKLIAAWFVPDIPQSVKNKVLEEKYQRLWEKMWKGRPSWAGAGPGSYSRTSTRSTEV